MLPDYFQNNNKDFSILHLNIRSLQKHFNDFKSFLSHLNFLSKIICLSKTWLHDPKHAASFALSNYQMINLYQQNGRSEEGVCIFIHESLDFKERKDLNISKNYSEIGSIEITNKTKNIILSSVYRPHASSLKELKSCFKPIFDNIRTNNKDLYLVGDFNINVLTIKVKMQKFTIFAFQNGLPDQMQLQLSTLLITFS